MKKTIAISALSLAAIGAFAQGQITFNNKVTGVVTHIYSPQLGSPSVETTGDGSNDTPAGTVVYTGTALGGFSGTGQYTGGARYAATIWAAAGQNQPDSSLNLYSQYNTTFRTSGGSGSAGFVIAPPANTADAGITGTAGAGNAATVEVRVYDTVGLSVVPTTFAQWTATVGVDHGQSLPINVTGLYDGNTANIPGTPPNLVGLSSFSLIAGAVPEPSTIALGVMGAAAFLLRRRNK